MENGELKFARNVKPTKENNWNVDNVNIIHPCPHILYLLKAGFKDVGFDLEGDILTDELLSHRWIFSGTEYFSREYLGKETYEIYQKDRVKMEETRDFYVDFYSKKILLKEIDGYRFDFHFKLPEYSELGYAMIIHNNSQIQLSDNYGQKEQFTLSEVLDTTSENTEVEIKFAIKRSRSRPSGPNGNNNGTGGGTGGGTRGGGNGQGGGTRGEGLGSKVLELVIKSKKAKETTSDPNDDEIKVIDNKKPYRPYESSS